MLFQKQIIIVRDLLKFLELTNFILKVIVFLEVLWRVTNSPF